MASVCEIETIEDVVVLVQGEREMTATKWARFREAVSSPGVRKVLVVTLGGTIDGEQRADAKQLLRDGKQVVIVTDSAAARVVSTALRWLGLDLHQFSLNDLAQAIQRVGFSPLARQDALRRIDGMLQSVR